MPTVKAVDLINEASNQLIDPGAVRWPKAVLLGYLNEAQLTLVTMRPDVLVKNEMVTCVAGARQSIAGIALLDVTHNHSGESITIVDRHVLDRHVPGWMKATASAVAEHFVVDPRDKKRFDVYPPAIAGTTKVWTLQSVVPEPIVISSFESSTVKISVGDEWESAITEYMLYKAWARDTESLGNPALANTHLATFRGMVGDSVLADAAMKEPETK